MRVFTLITAILFAIQTYAQDVKGYYITDSGKKVEGFFEVGDYNDSASLKFKVSRNAGTAAIPSDVVEYGVEEEQLKFEKHTVKIDVSKNSDVHSDPQWDSQTLFLNVVVKGNAALYSYTKDYITKYFFSVGEQDNIRELIYKKHTDANGKAIENNAFRQQLYREVACKWQDASEFMELPYHEKQLEEVFVKYNKCVGSESETFGPVKESGFSYSIVAGIYNTNMEVTRAKPAVDDQTTVTYGFGAEAAYTFPSETFSFFAGVEFELMNVEVTDSAKLMASTTVSNYKMDSNAFNFYFGPRYNLVLNGRNKLFFDVAPGVSIPFGDITQTTIIIPDTGDPYPGIENSSELRAGFYVNLGMGYTFDEKYSIALRYQTRRGFLDDVNGMYDIGVSRVGLLLKYTFK
jgi:hypothetical protein